MPNSTIALRRMRSARHSDARESVSSIDTFDLMDADAAQYENKDRRNASGPIYSPTTLYVKREGRRFDGVARLAALGFTTFSAGYTTYLIASSNPRSLSWFAYHPPLQMASIVLFTLGILTLQPTSTPKSKAAGLVRHQICMLLAGAPLLAAGTWAIYHNKYVKARPHFTTWHGTIGIIAVGWLAVQMLIGCASVWFGGAALGGGMKAKAVWKYHRLSGYIVYPLFLYAAHLGGAWSTYANAHASHIMRLGAYSIGPIITVVAVLSRIRLSKMTFC